MVNTGYCVKCKKKVVKPSASEKINHKERIGGKPFPDNIHADEGQAQNELIPDKEDNYNENPAVKDRYQVNIVQHQADEDKDSNDRGISVEIKTETISEFLQMVDKFIETNK